MTTEKTIINVSGTDPQMQFWNDPLRFRAFIGGVGSGKTYAGALECLRQEPSRGAIIAPTYRMLMDATLDTVLKLYDKANLIKSWIKSEMRMITTNGLDIIFRSGDDPEKLRGPNLGWFWLDEAAMMPEMVFKIMLGRLRLDPGRAWLTTTPKGMNWVFNLFGKGGREDYGMTQCSTRSNIFLPEYFIESLDTDYKGAWKEQEMEGQFVDWVSAPAYEAFNRSRNTAPNLMNEYRERLPLKLCCDFNARCMVWPVIQVNGRQPRALCEIAMVGRTSIPEMVRQFRLVFPAHPGGIEIYGDATGGGLTAQTGVSSYDIMLEAFKGYPSRIEIIVPKTNPPVRSRVNSMNRVLVGTGEWEPLVIDEDCDMFIRDLAFVEWDDSGTKLNKISNLEDERSTLTHTSDAAGYWASIDAPMAGIYVPREETVTSMPGSPFQAKMGPRELELRLRERERLQHQGLFGLDLE